MELHHTTRALRLIDTIEQLHELIAEVGRIILHENEIEIYDDYRE